MQDMEWLTELVAQENERLRPVMGIIPPGRMEICAFIMERYLDAIKSDPSFNHEVFQSLNEVMTVRMCRAKASQMEDPKQVMRRLEVAAMMDKAIRDGLIKRS